VIASIEEELAALIEGQRLDDPWPIWREARESAAVHLLPGNGIAVVTRYADVRRMSLDAETYTKGYVTSGSRYEAVMRSLEPDVADMMRSAAEFEGLMIGRTGEPLHGRLRQVAHRYFTPAYVAALEPVIQGFIDDLLATEIDEQGVFDAKDVARDLALRVMTEVVGAPQMERHVVRDLVHRLQAAIISSDPDVIRDAYAARQEFRAYVEHTIVDAYRRDPEANDLAAAMMDAEQEESLSAPELVAMVANLLTGGLETTTCLLTTGLIELLRERTEWEKLTADPGLAPTAVEELLRWVSPSQWSHRLAQRDTVVGGTAIPAGQTIVLAAAAANRDPDLLPNGDTLDIGRRPTRHLALGVGPRYCLGNALLRLEARLFFGTLAERHPGLELATDGDDLDWSDSNPILRSVARLPISVG